MSGANYAYICFSSSGSVGKGKRGIVFPLYCLYPLGCVPTIGYRATQWGWQFPTGQDTDRVDREGVKLYFLRMVSTHLAAYPLRISDTQRGWQFPARQDEVFLTLDILLIAKSLVTSPRWVLLECSTDPAHFDLMAWQRVLTCKEVHFYICYNLIGSRNFLGDPSWFRHGVGDS